MDRKFFMIDSCSDLSENQQYAIQKILAQEFFELFDLKVRISTSVEQKTSLILIKFSTIMKVDLLNSNLL